VLLLGWIVTCSLPPHLLHFHRYYHQVGSNSLLQPSMYDFPSFLSCIIPGCLISIYILDRAYLQVLLVDFHVIGRESLFLSNSQHSSSAFDGCFLLQCLQIGASLYFLLFLSFFFSFSSLVWLLELVGFLFSFLGASSLSWRPLYLLSRSPFDGSGFLLVLQ
jgi:hypothetical protein